MKQSVYQSRENGSIIYLSVLGFAILFMFLAFLSDMLVKNRKDIELRIKLDGLALNISEAGLFETLAQFRKKGTMGHKRNPQRDGSGNEVLDGLGQVVYLSEENSVDLNFLWTCKNAAVGCTNQLDKPFHYEIAYDSLFEDHTDDVCDECTTAGRSQKGFYIPESEEPKIGVVRNFDVLGKTYDVDPITHEILNGYGDLKVRYEVWERMVEDYSKETGYDSSDSGRIWAAKSIGIAYKVNKVSSAEEMETLSTVVQTRMYKKPNINFPYKAALYNTNINGIVNKNANSEIINNGDKVTVYSGIYGKTTNMTIAMAGLTVIDFGFTGVPLLSTALMDYQTVFGLDEPQMKEFADTVITDVTDPRMDKPLMDSEIRFVVGNVNYTLAKPLLGNGILIIDGNVTITSHGHKFDGILWVTGNLTVTGGGYVKGCIVTGGKVSAAATLSIAGENASNFFRVYYDPETIATLNSKKFKYTMFRVPYVKKGAGSIVLSDAEKDLRKKLIFARYK